MILSPSASRFIVVMVCAVKIKQKQMVTQVLSILWRAKEQFSEDGEQDRLA